MKPIDKNVGEYDLTAEKKAGMITGTIRGELPDSDANLPQLPFSGTFAPPRVAQAIADIQQPFPDNEPAIIDDLREELLKAGF